MRSKTPRLSELKRAVRWLREQYRRRAEEAAAGRDRTIERIRKSKLRTTLSKREPRAPPLTSLTRGRTVGLSRGRPSGHPLSGRGVIDPLVRRRQRVD